MRDAVAERMTTDRSRRVLRRRPEILRRRAAVRLPKMTERPGETQSITVSAAASLTDVLNELAEKYKEQDPGMEISLPSAAAERCRHRSKRERLWICFSPQRRKIWMRWRRKA